MPQPTRIFHADLRSHWLITGGLLLSLIVYIVVCHVWAEPLQLGVEESQRVMIRTLLYAVAIILFPLTKLLRHILLRLNQTMPGDKSPRQRYLLTIIVCQALIELVGSFGLLMFMLGDGFNTLYIFTVLGGLGLFLHKPDLLEYQAIIQALAQNQAPSP